MTNHIDWESMRNGDDVTVCAKIAGVGTKFISAVFETALQPALISVPLEAIATHTPKPREFKPGDKVITSEQRDGVVIATDDAFVWVRTDNDGRFVYYADRLRHADEGAPR